MPVTLRIPKLTDREIIVSLGRIRKEVTQYHAVKFNIYTPHKSFELLGDAPESNPDIGFILEANTNAVNSFHIRDCHDRDIVCVRRVWDQITDTAQIPDEWVNNFGDSPKISGPNLFVKVMALVRNELKVADLEASFKGQEDNSWNRYRDAQMSVVNSLQQATENLIVKAAEKNAELDKARSLRFEKLEGDLRAQIDAERKAMQTDMEAKNAAISERERAFAEKELAFNTKEARYVARQKQQEQIDQIKNWLNDWSLTKGTTQKRRPIFWAYISALAITGGLAIYATYRNYELLKTADDIAKLVWWQWVAISAKAILPLAAFTTFMVYFIRWSSAWARQHAEEEFLNRTRLIDIGRSSWLLEAVRDAHEKGNDLPEELLKELSRNLFSNHTSVDGDIHPQTAADMLLNGLSSLRVKSPDGTEVEAKRGK